MQTASHENPLRLGLAAARANLGPGLALIAVALAIVVSYDTLPAFTESLDALARFREQRGLIFAIISTALFGGTIPIIIQQLRPSTRRAAPWPTLLFLTFFWGLKGIEVEFLYKLEAQCFGDNPQWTTILLKTFFDQFIYCVIWAVPVTTLAYLFNDCGRDLGATRRRLSPGWYARYVLPTLLANWGVWIPAVALIYSLKLPLQLPVQNIVLCLWAILMLSMSRGAAKKVPAIEPTVVEVA